MTSYSNIAEQGYYFETQIEEIMDSLEIEDVIFEPDDIGKLERKEVPNYEAYTVDNKY